jgi:CSLREA domain-containing protein
MNKFFKLALVLFSLTCLSQISFAATYTVTKTADTSDGMCDADCSLREAIVAANATADNDTIQFAALFNLPQTITLSGTDLIITNNGTLAITGPGANLLTVSGNNASRVFSNNTGAVTTISNLRVTGGNGVSSVTTGRGGGVYNNGGTLTLMNVVVTGNTAANGGGLNNAGTATFTLINCTVSNNTSTSSGGGMQNFAGNTMNIINSTVSGNVSNSNGIGGGAVQANGVINIANSTFSGNSAPIGTGGAIYYNGTGMTMNNVMIANNSAAIGAGGLHKATATLNASVRNTIIANNSGAAANPDVFGEITSRGNNLIGVVGTSTGWIASDLLNQNPLLAPLANNGGPTQTHALLPGSPAINAGQNCVTTATCVEGNPPQPLTTDQRGLPRLVGAMVDIGAYEVNPICFCTTRAPFDFDGDGRTDYAVFRPSNGTWFIQRSTAGFVAQPFGVSTDRLTPVDFDGDGKTDIAVWRENSGVPLRAFFYVLQSSNNNLRAEQFGGPFDNPLIVGDWDGDGRADPAVYRNGAGGSPSQFFYRPSSQPGVDFVPINWGAAGDEPVRGDFDGDGRLDAAVFRPSDGNWYIRQSSNNTLRVARWGAASDRRVSGDFDGDGRTDLAVFRDGLWAILQSSNNQQRYQNWGAAGDRLVPGDYDGDGKTDIAVWRSGVFYVLRSSDNQGITVQFGASTDVPVASAFNP